MQILITLKGSPILIDCTRIDLNHFNFKSCGDKLAFVISEMHRIECCHHPPSLIHQLIFAPKSIRIFVVQQTVHIPVKSC